MIDLASETLLTLEQAGEKILVSKATLYRWITHGTRGIKLEAVRVGGRWRTSEEALQRFSDCLTPNQTSNIQPAPVPVPTSRERQRHLERIERELEDFLGPRRCETCRTPILAPNGAIRKEERVWCPDCLIKRKSATLGQRIRSFRWAASLAQHALSSRTGISIDNIRAYEFDEKEPTDAHLAKLIEAFGEKLASGLAVRCQTEPTEAATIGPGP